mgnify:FL=1
MATYEEPEFNPFDAPVPGQSLTDEPRNYPWEHPARFAEFLPASHFVWNRLHEGDNLKNILGLMQMGVPVEALVRTPIFSGFIEGLWSVDLALLLVPTVSKMYVAIATAGGLEDIKLNMNKKKTNDIVEQLSKFKALESTKSEEKVKEFEDDVVKGLMSRKSEEE